MKEGTRFLSRLPASPCCGRGLSDPLGPAGLECNQRQVSELAGAHACPFAGGNRRGGSRTSDGSEYSIC